MKRRGMRGGIPPVSLMDSALSTKRGGMRGGIPPTSLGQCPVHSSFLSRERLYTLFPGALFLPPFFVGTSTSCLGAAVRFLPHLPHLSVSVGKKKIAPNTKNFYYRDNFANRKRRTKERDVGTPPANAGLINCDQICYSNAIFQGLASCIRVSQFFKVHQGIKRFPLYHAFASIMSSMVSGRETVVNPSKSFQAKS
jgi:hypothetical protein